MKKLSYGVKIRKNNSIFTEEKWCKDSFIKIKYLPSDIGLKPGHHPV